MHATFISPVIFLVAQKEPAVSSTHNSLLSTRIKQVLAGALDSTLLSLWRNVCEERKLMIKSTASSAVLHLSRANLLQKIMDNNVSIMVFRK